MTTNKELENLGLIESERTGYWEKISQDSVILKVHLDRKDLKDKYLSIMNDINTFLALPNPTQAQFNAATKKIVEIMKFVLIYHKIEIEIT